MRIQNKESIFKTADFSLAIYLYAAGIPFVGLEPTVNPHKSLFLFKQSKTLDSTVHKFWQGKTKVEPMKLLNAHKTLKQILFSNSNFLPGRVNHAEPGSY